MKIAAAHDFHDQVTARAAAISGASTGTVTTAIAVIACTSIIAATGAR